MYKNQTPGAFPPPSIRPLLELSKLSRLPSLPSRKPLFEIPNFSAAPEIRQDICAVCEKHISKDDEFPRNLRVCRKCLIIHARVETAIDARTVEKHKTAKFAAWSEKLGGAK